MALAVGDSGYGKAAASANVTSETITCAGDNRILIAALMWLEGGLEAGFSSIKWGGSGGTALTQIGSTVSGPSGFGECHVALAYLLNPATGDSTLYGTCSQAMDVIAVGGVFLTGADVAGTPLGSLVSADGESALATVNASSAAGEIVVDAVVSYDNTEIAVGASQAAAWLDATFGGAKGSGGMSTEAGAATTTMSWTVFDDVWVIAAVPVKPSLAGSTGGSLYVHVRKAL